MSILTIDGIENTVRLQAFTQRVVKAANAHMRITEPTWDLYDVKVATESHAIHGPKVAVTLFFKDNGLGIMS